MNKPTRDVSGGGNYSRETEAETGRGEVSGGGKYFRETEAETGKGTVLP